MWPKLFYSLLNNQRFLRHQLSNINNIFARNKSKRQSGKKDCESPPSCEAKQKVKSCGQDFEVCTIQDCMVDPCKPEPAIIIIGAGIAGLSAAHRLVQCGITNFTILEATDRPGGRIHSCWLGDVIAEMGAHVIEGGCVGNPIYNLAAQEGLLKQPLCRPNQSKGIFCTSDGRTIDHYVAQSAYHVFRSIEREAYTLFSMGCGKGHGSLMNFFAVRIQQELQNFPPEQKYDVSRVLHSMVDQLKNIVGEDFDKPTLNRRMIRPLGEENLGIPLRCSSILVPLLKEIPENSIILKKPVAAIRWGAVHLRENGPRVLVKTTDGDEYNGDYCIITVSLGVLKEHADKIFCPPLPSHKTSAISNLGYGNVDKVFLDYERPIWVWSDKNIKFNVSNDEIKSHDWTKSVSAIEEVQGSKNVLCAYVSGPDAAVMEFASDGEVAEGITKVLRKCTGDKKIPHPSHLLKSKWVTDPYFCGSYSYIKGETNEELQNNLSSPVPGNCDPVPPILFFAGEATCPIHHSTVHGARLSGIREADRICELTKRYGGPPPDC